MPIEMIKDKWPGSVREVKIGATAAEGGTRAVSVVVGGEKAMPYMHFESPMPHTPVVAIEIKDRKPDDWSPLLLEFWGETANDPAKWAKAAEDAGADLIELALSLTDAEGNPTTPEGLWRR
jgi:acetyl-CoA decarbonylase/synthase complex subunit delta